MARKRTYFDKPTKYGWKSRGMGFSTPSKSRQGKHWSTISGTLAGKPKRGRRTTGKGLQFPSKYLKR